MNLLGEGMEHTFCYNESTDRSPATTTRVLVTVLHTAGCTLDTEAGRVRAEMSKVPVTVPAAVDTAMVPEVWLTGMVH